MISTTLLAGRTDIGKIRLDNQDQFLVADLNRSMTIHSSSLPVEDETQLYSNMAGQLLVVCDGISGAPAGRVASQIGVGTVARYVLNAMPWFLSLNHDHDDDQEEELLAALLEVESAVEDEAAANPEFEGMGTTLTMAYIVWPRLYVVNIGDSRCYLLRGGGLEQLTHDQTVAQGLIERGTLTSDQAVGSPLAHVLVSSIGQGLSYFHPDVYKTELEDSDRILICTDGLTNLVDDVRIAELLGAADSPETACETLIDEANDLGGHDNITVAVAFCHPPKTKYPRV
ncbi:MAG: protein phosphatase 2C domain-containing protein [Acidimicrobiia bacterium]|nr:protein phosphatase 2C domain-containing protein [Acidimicrobiia bacterium]